MSSHRSSVHRLSGAIACIASLVVAAPARAVFFNPPSNQAPSSLGGNSRRGGCAADEAMPTDLQERARIVSFLPVVPDPNQVVALTIQASPSMWVYVPPTSAQTVEFALFDNMAEDYVYLGSFPIATSGLYRIDLPPEVELKTDRADAPQDYTWFLDLVCEPGRLENNLSTLGTLKRVSAEVSGTLQTDLAAAPDAIERAKAYGANGIWLDMISEVAIAEDRETGDPAALDSYWKGIFEVALPESDRAGIDRDARIERLTAADRFVADLTDSIGAELE